MKVDLPNSLFVVGVDPNRDLWSSDVGKGPYEHMWLRYNEQGHILAVLRQSNDPRVEHEWYYDLMRAGRMHYEKLHATDEVSAKTAVDVILRMS
jgi:hypothetical protein